MSLFVSNLSSVRRLARIGRAVSVGAFLFAALTGAAVQAAPSILVDAATGEVLEQQEATRSWFPASTTKLMTVYVALDAVSAGRISLNTPIYVSPRAASMAPSKMGFAPGTQVTLDNALKMLMVKSANDIAVTIAEGVSGSVEAFAGEMNTAADKLGMRESRFYNPNGLPDPRHVSSARDLAVLARALLTRFPDHLDLFDIGAMRVGGRIFPTHNGLLGRYPGVDGMKTGFTCSAGFNIVASATRGGRHLIAVVLGAPSTKARDMKAVSLFNHGFSGKTSSSGSVASLTTNGVTEAPDARNGVCMNRTKAQKDYLAGIEDEPVTLTSDSSQSLINQPERALFAFGGLSAPPQNLEPSAVVSTPRPAFTPIDVFVGPVPGWTGQIAHADDYAGPPPVTATAYAADKTADAPLKPSADALPMKRGKTKAVAKADSAKAHLAKAHLAKAHPAKAVVARAKPEADEDEAKGDEPKAKVGATHVAKPARAKATAHVQATAHVKVAKVAAERPEHPKTAPPKAVKKTRDAE